MELEPAVREEAADNIQRQTKRAVGIMGTANNNMAWAQDIRGPQLSHSHLHRPIPIALRQQLNRTTLTNKNTHPKSP